MASNWIPFHADLLEGRHLGVSFGARFTLLAISMKAKRLDGIVELPFAKDDVDAVCKVTGGERRDVKACLDFYTRPAGSDKEPTLVIEERDGQRIIRIPGWQRRAGFGREPKGASTARVQAHRERTRNASETRETAEPTEHETAVSSLHGVTPETLGNAPTGQDITGQDNGSPPVGAPRAPTHTREGDGEPGPEPSPDDGDEAGEPVVVAVAPLALTSPGMSPPEKQPRDRRKPQRPCPDDFRPSESNWDYAAERGLSRADVDRAVPRFVNWHQARDNRFADWPKAFRNWLENTRPGEGEPTGPRPLPGVSTLQQPSQCWEAGPEYTG